MFTFLRLQIVFANGFGLQHSDPQKLSNCEVLQENKNDPAVPPNLQRFQITTTYL